MIKSLPEPITRHSGAKIDLDGVSSHLVQAGDQQFIFMKFDHDVDVPEHSHEAQWGIVLNGEVELSIEGKPRVLRKGDTYFIEKDQLHSARIKKGYQDLTLFDHANRYEPESNAAQKSQSVDKLTTDRTVLRKMTVEDAVPLLALVERNRKTLLKHFGRHYKDMLTTDQVRHFIVANEVKWNERTELNFGIWRYDSLVGVMMIKNCDWWHCKCELAYYLDEELHGKGIMTEVMKRTISFCFEELKMEKLNLRTALDNYASQKVATRNGFEFEGVRKKDFKRVSGEIVDTNNYGITKEAYESH